MMKAASDVAGKSVAQALLWISYPKAAARIKSDITRDPIWRTGNDLDLDAVIELDVASTLGRR
jgi:hypothetical protein